MAHEGTRDRQCFIYPLIHSKKLTYLQLKNVFVYGNSPSKSYEQDYLNF